MWPHKVACLCPWQWWNIQKQRCMFRICQTSNGLWCVCDVPWLAHCSEWHFHFLHACLCCLRPQGVSLFAPWVGFSLRCSCAACGLILFLRQRYIFFGPSPRALLCSLHSNTVRDRDVDNIVLEEYRRLLLWVNQTYSVTLDLYVLQMLPYTWRRFIRLVRRGRELSEAQWRSLFLTSQNRSLRLQLH
jgi:hypothetical protein